MVSKYSAVTPALQILNNVNKKKKKTKKKNCQGYACIPLKGDSIL